MYLVFLSGVIVGVMVAACLLGLVTSAINASSEYCDKI